MEECKSHPFRLLGPNRRTDRLDIFIIYIYIIHIRCYWLTQHNFVVPFAGVVGTTQGGRTQPYHLRAAHVQQ